MTLEFADYILLGVIAIFTWIGLWSGFISTLGSFLGVFLGAAIAARYYTILAPAWDWLVFGNERTAEIVIFISLFIIISRLVGIIFWFLNKLFNIVKLFPFLGSLNRLLGAILGFLEGVLIMATVLYFLTKYSITTDLVVRLTESQVGQILLIMVNVVKPLLPEALKNITSFGS